MPPDLQSIDRLPPQNREAERCVLGSMLRDNGAIADLLLILRAEDFYADANQKIFRGIVDLYNRSHPVEAGLLADVLRERQQIEDVGGYAYLGQLLDAAPTAATAVYYARIVRERSLVRQVAHTAADIARDAYDQVTPAEELLEAATRKFLEIAQTGIADRTADAAELVSDACDRYDARATRGGAVGIPSGFLDLDELTAGFQAGQLTVLAARTSVGKTCLAANIACNVALREDIPVLFFSLEQTREELIDRICCSEADIDSHKFRLGRLDREELRRFADAAARLRTAPLHVNDTPGQGMTRITANARRSRLRHGVRLVIVDYLQIIEPDSRRVQRYEQVGAISARLKTLARELQIPVIALAQLSRAAEEGREPRLSDLRESGNIEFDADLVLLMHCAEASKDGAEGRPSPVGVIGVNIAKQRNGPVGKLELVFRRAFQRFENIAVEAP